MENINFSDEIFSWKRMMPESSDWLTTSLMRRLSMNYINSYGLIGTCVLQTGQHIAINLGLTRKFTFPPLVDILFYAPDYSDVGLQYAAEFITGSVPTIFGIQPVGFVANDSLILIGAQSYVATMCFRIHGV